MAYSKKPKDMPISCNPLCAIRLPGAPINDRFPPMAAANTRGIRRRDLEYPDFAAIPMTTGIRTAAVPVLESTPLIRPTITIIAMTIVLAALIVLSILFLGFGKISSMLMGRKKLEAHGITKEEAGDDHKEVDSGETFAAIALALSQHLDQRHDIEDTILTIRRMRKAYSPWNSKIYNIRPVPAIHHNAPKK